MGSIDGQTARERLQGESDSVIEAGRFQHFGGITRVDEVQTDVPMIARLVGTNEAEGRRLLAESVLQPAESLADAAQKAVAAAQAR